ncbi:MAG TPA: hypothetical protein ENJ45_04610 [Phaeodactylibacter sp.]|nr:hypothetical protein [Phaeodactylibacter sp.]
MTNRLFLLIAFIAFAQISFAQSTLIFNRASAEKGLVYDKETTFDFTLHTTGFGIAAGFNLGKIRTYYKTTYYHFQVGELRHHKEVRQSAETGNPITGRSARGYFFGKRNNLYVLRAGKGVKRYLSEKAKEKGLAIGFSYEGGFSLGLLKPYYLELFYPQDGGTTAVDIRSEKYSEENASLFLNTNGFSIYGASGFTKGLKEMRPIPGIHFKAGAHFDWGSSDEMVKALEAGFMVDVFYKKIPLIIEHDAISNAENKAFFVNLYVTLQLGKRR